MKNMKTIFDYQFSGHSVEQLYTRFEMKAEEVKQMFRFFKKGSVQCRYNQVKNKMVSHPHQVVYYNEKYNMMLACDTITGLIATVMYLQPNKK
jgi:hypothetical protein